MLFSCVLNNKQVIASEGTNCGQKGNGRGHGCIGAGQKQNGAAKVFNRCGVVKQCVCLGHFVLALDRRAPALWPLLGTGKVQYSI